MKRRGFTLVEIMIVVAIIALLAAIAIPNLLRARINANESAAVSNIQTLSTAAQSFWSASATQVLPSSIDDLQNATPPYMTLCGTPSNCRKNGYGYAITGSGVPSAFVAYAWPQTLNTTGTRYFCVAADGIIKMSTTTNLTDNTTCSAATALP